MKLHFEEFTPDSDSSFRLIINPRLNDVFYWHFHPEFELVYIEGANGTRHVGEHISRFEGSDLVFIGSYIPHLNFDYGVKTECEKVVVQIRQDFLGNAFANIPELSAVYQLFEQAKHGIAFGSNTKLLLKKRLKNLKNLGHFEQFLEILSIFQVLAQSNEMILLHPKPVENQHNKKEQERLKRIYHFIDLRYKEKIEIEEVAALTNLNKSAFCRYFKKITRLTFVEFLNYYRINQAQKLLLLDKNVTEACFGCGFESLSYFNRTFRKVTGENPLSFKKKFLSEK
ncbi:helix-turn-helix domain-containing protein [Emticicia agri]|uniref:AraC family transcriptional regulator n=1 Tax=Emticicia agri TaxID=2492393 RepID=A0A4Q5LZ17_9BACT|nr:AraC family transcriptional regulator [Emticicia agri]RYU95084.1 AraC family transcriptional regulator [Emticicia agri]